MSYFGFSFAMDSKNPIGAKTVAVTMQQPANIKANYNAALVFPNVFSDIDPTQNYTIEVGHFL
jgi:hypothetical protein